MQILLPFVKLSLRNIAMSGDHGTDILMTAHRQPSDPLPFGLDLPVVRPSVCRRPPDQLAPCPKLIMQSACTISIIVSSPGRPSRSSLSTPPSPSSFCGLPSAVGATEYGADRKPVNPLRNFVAVRRAFVKLGLTSAAVCGPTCCC